MIEIAEKWLKKTSCVAIFESLDDQRDFAQGKLEDDMILKAVRTLVKVYFI